MGFSFQQLSGLVIALNEARVRKVRESAAQAGSVKGFDLLRLNPRARPNDLFCFLDILRTLRPPDDSWKAPAFCEDPDEGSAKVPDEGGDEN